MREETVTEIIIGFFLDLNYLSLISIKQAKIVAFVKNKIIYQQKVFQGAYQRK